jgi:hypothetical protein
MAKLWEVSKVKGKDADFVVRRGEKFEQGL